MQWRPINKVSTEHGVVLVVHWRRVAFLGVSAGLGLWLGGAWAAWLFVKYYHDFPEVKYADLVWPGRWASYRASEGDYYIAHAGPLLRKGEAAAALYQLRAGVRKSPGNADGRTTLAGLYLAYRRPDLARELLLEGLKYLPDDAAYLQTTLAFLLEFQEDEKLMEITRPLLAASSPASPTCRSFAATFAATAAFYRGNFDLAEDLINQHHLADTADGAILLAKVAWERNYPELAVLRLTEHLAQFPNHDNARALLVSYYRSLGRTNEWQSAIVERVVSDPFAAAPRIEYLYLYHQRHDEPRVQREAAAYLSQFPRDSKALLLLADFAATTGRPALARRVQEIFAANGENTGAAALLVAEAHIVAGDYQPAVSLIADYNRQYPEWTGQFASVFNGLQAVAFYGLGKKDEARLYLDNLLTQKNLRADNLVAVASRLSALGARDLALSTLARAVEADPLNQGALTNLIRLELDTGNLAALPAHLERFIHTRQPSREILARAYETLGSDRFLFLAGQTELLASLRTALTSRRP